MMPCNEIGAKIAHGFRLNVEESQHVTGCDACAAALASFAELDALLGQAGLDAPSGFADRVVARIAAGSAEMPSWFERRSVQLLFAHAGALAALGNVLFFVASVFLATPSFGGAP